MSDCLDCALYMGCTKSKKGVGYSCKKFTQQKGMDFANLFQEGGRSPALLSSEGKKKKKKRQSDIIITPEDMYDDEDDSKADRNIRKMMKSALSAQTRAPIDFRIDDQELPEFPNFWSYCISPNGLNTKPFPRQLWMLTMLFGEYCPKCSDPKIDDVDSIDVNEPVYDVVGSKLVLLNFGVCPKCGARKSKLIKKGRMNLYVELNACLGQRSGKSVSTSMGASYLTHKMLKMQSPTTVYGLLRDSLLTATFVGLTFQRAMGLLWTPFHSTLSTAPWFQEYHKLLDYYGEKYDDDEIYKFGAQSIHYKHRNFFLSPSGPSKRTLRGDTRVFAAIDELGWFPNDSEDDERERQSANEVHIALDRSMKTVRSAAMTLVKEGVDNVLTGIMINISSPAHARDKIMSLVRESEGSDEQLGIHLPTWEFNPNLPRAAFKKEYRSDSVKAERDFGANPPLNEKNFFTKDSKSLATIFGPHGNRISYKYVVKSQSKKHGGKRMRHAEITTIRTGGSAVPPAILALDAGYSNNSFGMAVGHINTVNGKRQVIFDGLVEIAPKHKKDVLNYTRIHREMIEPIIKQLNIKAVITDRWQNKKILHDIMEDHPDVAIQEYSLRYEDMMEVRDYMQDEDRLILLPKMELKPKEIDQLDITSKYPHCFKYLPTSHCFFQMQTVQDMGNTVVKGPNLTDDVFRAVLLAGSFLLDTEFCNEYLKGTMERRTAALGYVGGLSGMGIRNTLINRQLVGVSTSKDPVEMPVAPSNVGTIGSKFRP